MATKKERHMQQLGMNLQLMMKRMGYNQNLLRYLYYTDKDPLSKDKPDVDFLKHIFKKQMLIIPIISNIPNAKSIITLRVLNGKVNKDNSETMDIFLNIEVFVPNTQWILKSDNLRPYLIMGEISKSLDNKSIEGLGLLNFHSFAVNFVTEEMSAFQMLFSLSQFK